MRVVRSIGPDTLIATSSPPTRAPALTEATPGARSSTLSTHSRPVGTSPRRTVPADPRVSGSRAPSATIVRSSWGDSSEATHSRASPSRT